MGRTEWTRGGSEAARVKDSKSMKASPPPRPPPAAHLLINFDLDEINKVNPLDDTPWPPYRSACYMTTSRLVRLFLLILSTKDYYETSRTGCFSYNFQTNSMMPSQILSLVVVF
jgi:hypothetical protein